MENKHSSDSSLQNKSDFFLKSDNLIYLFPYCTHGVLYMFEAKVTIQLKKGISDPEGANTLKALHLLGFSTVKDAKTIRTIDMIIDGTNKDKIKKDVEQMCQRLLTNPVIHTYEISIKEQ